MLAIVKALLILLFLCAVLAFGALSIVKGLPRFRIPEPGEVTFRDACKVALAELKDSRGWMLAVAVLAPLLLLGVSLVENASS